MSKEKKCNSDKNSKEDKYICKKCNSTSNKAKKLCKPKANN
jgi:hypothetical protein